ncbi:ABC transporter substrate-binding protein [Alkalihalobacillus alcalophilus ATCC 27647 = CGMCC 1.3604]|uniref:ABC transporter substrate-binding protein n=1 Tax=Alkalihalobacillus alcalophilus ATCC 27647 = CGMCC 1.3604 TaxID=1218173 RepID=A0A094WN51_ALKAL|nr:ABC transporter substrate-binding protein [Alkalihalobacillus alcalophilus]KGA97398.1 ABC transporter substrate-binding protein [Alkalihalobacillus alcalophilus ATCC 27647 = CGMCC 1.3604]MED1561807.1 ABC transporter substrate-binding protein [Alkalihalobacillus alcalophilus]THG90773.1 ABC transporter substrate-binding protein [Alkalihalobacillus alcalophilus ATCC 27647 = CGMCC 1.3604]
MKHSWKKWTAITLLGMTLAACGTSESSGDGESYKVGATQIAEHPSLDAAYEGFKQALEDAGLDVEYDYNTAQGDQNNNAAIASNLVSNDVDLIFANSTPSAQSALQATDSIPIIFTSVTDAVAGELVTAMDEPGENITGVVDLHPDTIQFTVIFLEEYFANSRIGMIYNAGEANSVAQINLVEEAVEGTSLSLVTRSVATATEVQQAAASLVGDIDVFYIITDNTAVTALDAIVQVANSEQIPLFVGEPDSLEKGGFATFGIDYFSIGYRSGEMAAEVLQGEKSTSDIPVEYPSEMQLFINKDAAEAQGVEWHSDWDEDAEIVEAE